MSRQYISLNLDKPYLCLLGPTHAIALLSLSSLFDANKQSALQIIMAGFSKLSEIFMQYIDLWISFLGFI